ncbi:MAG: hypothetical protein ACI3T9_02235 [Romboutsia timonensis]
METNNIDVDSVLLWANEVADKTGRSITSIISHFASANKRLKDVEAAKIEVANKFINSK